MTKAIIFGFLGLFILLMIIAVNTDSSKEESPSIAINRCVNVSEQVINRITGGLKDGDKDIPLSNWQAVKSKDFSDVHFVSTKLNTGGGAIATFAVNDFIEGAGMTFSVDSVAKEFFLWPLGSDTSFNISLFDDGVAESQECTKNL